MASIETLLATPPGYASAAVARFLWQLDERRVTRPRPDGGTRVFNPGWVLYHLIEHEAGHHAQINLLRHLRNVAG